MGGGTICTYEHLAEGGPLNVAKPNLSPELRQACVNTIKMLAVDAIEKAKSGHPGAPMGCADMAFVLWTQFIPFNPERPA